MAAIPKHSSDSSPSASSSAKGALDDVIAAYLEALEAGNRVDRVALTAEHPDLAVELAVFFANQDHVARLTAPLRDSSPEARSSDRDFRSSAPPQPSPSLAWPSQTKTRTITPSWAG